MHALRQLGYTEPRDPLGLPDPPATNRGNGYLQPDALAGYQAVKNGIFPNFDCKNTSGGELNNKPPTRPTTRQILPGQSARQGQLRRPARATAPESSPRASRGRLAQRG